MEVERYKDIFVMTYGKEAYIRKLAKNAAYRKANPIVMKNLRKENNEYLLKAREYKKNNKAAIAIQRKGYGEEHKDELAEYQKIYRQTLNGKAAHNKGEAKRYRDLGFIVLNLYFEGCEGHHITHNFVIYIPKGLHKSVWHNLNTGQGMEIINALALEFLVNGF